MCNQRPFFLVSTSASDTPYRSTASPVSLPPFVPNNPPTPSMRPSQRPLAAHLSCTTTTLLPTFLVTTVPTPIPLHQPLVRELDPTPSLAKIPPDQYVASTLVAEAPLPLVTYFPFHHTLRLLYPWEAVQARTHMQVTTDTSTKAASVLPLLRQMGVK